MHFSRFEWSILWEKLETITNPIKKEFLIWVINEFDFPKGDVKRGCERRIESF